MRSVHLFIDSIRATIEFWVGENAKDNFDIIDQAKPNDLWFHVSQRPSCHVVAVIPEGKKYDKKQLHKIIVQGSVLCKKHSKYDSIQKLSIMYSNIHNITKTDTVGAVNIDTYKTIVI